MNTEIYTDYGKISYDTELIKEKISCIFDKTANMIFLGNPGAKKKKSSDDSSFIDISMNDEKLDIYLCVIVRFGTSIKNATSLVMESIKDEIFNTFGIENIDIRIKVSGVKTANNIAYRNIEVSSDGI